MKIKGIKSLKFQVFFLAAISASIPLLLSILTLHTNFIIFFEERIEKEIMEIAIGAAESNDVKNSLIVYPPNKELLQKTSNELKNRTGAYVFFIDMSGTALIDPFPFEVHTEVKGEDKDRVLQGDSIISRSSAFSTPSIRAFVPVKYNGRQIGAVVAAYLEPDIKLIISQLYQSVYIVLPLALVLILILSMFLANNIKKRLFGMEPQEIATYLKEREGILQSVKEGIIATDYDLNITVVNQLAAGLFPPDTKIIGEKITTLITDQALPEIIAANKPYFNKQIYIKDSIVLCNSFPLVIKDKVVGTVLTFRELSLVNRLAEELTGVKELVKALRARTHEFSNKLHVISGLLELESYEEAKKYVSRVSSIEKSMVEQLLSSIKINAVTGLLMGKASEAQEYRIKYEVSSDSLLVSLPDYFDEHACVIVLGNLIENAFEATKNYADKPEVSVTVKQTETAITIEVRDNGPGIPEHYISRIFESGFTTKLNGTGYGLYNVKNRISSANGQIFYSKDVYGTTFYVTIPFNTLLRKEGE